jgi:beta-N-acetylhexosaminidase
MIKVPKRLVSGVIFSLLIFMVGCARVAVKPGLTFGPPESRWVEKTLRKMSLEEKIGQMIVLRCYGRFVNRDSEYFQNIQSLVLEHNVGGLLFFAGNVFETAHQINAFQKMAKYPLLIAADFECGSGFRIEGATLFPPLMSLGAIGSEELSFLMGKITALEARAMGVHVTFAPVVDVNINPDNPIINVRSFGENPEQVSRLAAPFIRGCQENGLIATAKHFPGHGDTDLDSHIVLPTVEGDRERLEEVELYPFKKAIEAGVQMIMSAHIRLPALDPSPDMPATLSRPILTDLLRKELGFRGIIVTDAMDMGGVTTLYSPDEAAVRTVKAGADMILLPLEPEKVIDALVQAIRDGRIPERRIDESVRRILQAKERVGLHRTREVSLEYLDRRIATREHLQAAADAFDSSITLVKNDGDVIPLTREGIKVAVFSLSSDPGGYFDGMAFVEEVKKRYPDTAEFFADAFTGEEFIREAATKADDADVLVFALFSRLESSKGSVGLNPQHIQLLQEASSLSKSSVVISFGSPYFLRHFPEVDAYICAYRAGELAQISAARAIFGEIDVSGRLPVSIPELYPPGHGLKLLKEGKSKE